MTEGNVFNNCLFNDNVSSSQIIWHKMEGLGNNDQKGCGRKQSGLNFRYSTLLRFWLAKELIGLADGPNGCGELVMGGCSFAWNFCVTGSTVLVGHREDARPNRTLMPH
jgi:hypothetical protein